MNDNLTSNQNQNCTSDAVTDVRTKEIKKNEAESTPVTFHHHVSVQIRFNDVDGYGHVNNNSYFAYYDLGKEDYLRKVLSVNYSSADVVPVIANINADFFQPIFHGDDIEIETRVSHVGKKSFTLQQRAINKSKNVVVCQCQTIMVCFNLKTQESVEVPEKFRASILAYENQ